MVETSPVGVVVFDAKTASAALINREARRIVEPLNDPGQTAMELSKTVISCYAGGREVTVEQLTQREELRAAEMELAVRDGTLLHHASCVMGWRRCGGDAAASPGRRCVDSCHVACSSRIAGVLACLHAASSRPVPGQ